MEEEIQTDADWQTERERLNADIRRLEAALIEAKEVTRVKVTEEVQDEFAIKLRESKRQKAKLEEEFEEASERWRGERRRLNSEIDQLEQSVQKARSDARRARPAESAGELQAQLEEAEKSHHEAERELREARARWETERQELHAKLSRLESQVIETLERSSNPTRSTRGGAEAAGPVTPSPDQQKEIDRLQAEQKGLQVERDALRTQIVELESEFAAEARRLKAAEEQLAAEKRRSDAEREDTNEKLKHLEESLSAGESKIDSSELTALRAELEGRIEAAEASRSEAVERMESVTAEWDTERQRMGSTIEDMNRKLSEGDAKIDRVELDALREELLARLEESEREKAGLDEKLAGVTRQWAEEKSSFESRLSEEEKATQSDREAVESELREKLTLEYEWKLKELTFQKEQLEQKLHTGAAAAPQGSATSDATEEIAQVDEQIAEITTFIDDPGSNLSTVIRRNVERSELEAYRRGLAYGLERAKKEDE